MAAHRTTHAASSRSSRTWTALGLLLAAAATALASRPEAAWLEQKPEQKAQATAAPAARLAELWVEPEPDRDLFHGVGGQRLAPDPAEEYTVIEIKIGGFSEGYTVVDSTEREWSTKFPPEAISELAVSRIHWGVGYHQAPSYLLREWKAKGATAPNPQLPARFREKNPDLNGMTTDGTWSFRDNPFVGTRELAGLLVLQALLENPDIKTSNNTVYALKTPAEGATKWYVVRDLGYSLGKSGFNAPRADIDAFEQAPFIRRVVDGRVEFEYGGQYKSRLDHITVADVRWICERLNKLTDRQWTDAFRAGGYESSVAERYIKRIKARVAEGLALK